MSTYMDAERTAIIIRGGEDQNIKCKGMDKRKL
jgi:hypothetical protein